MKKFTAILVSVFALLLFLSPQAGTAQPPDKEIKVFIDGVQVDFDVQPAIINDRTLVPFRPLAEALNVNVRWDAAAKTVTAANNGTHISLKIDSPTAYKNNRPLTLDMPPTIIDNRTLVPLRFFSEAFDCQVSWDNLNYLIHIKSNPSSSYHLYVLGYYALGDQQSSSWTDLFGRPYPHTATGNTDAVDSLALGWYSIDAKGNLITDSSTGWRRPEGWVMVLEAAEKYRLQTEMAVHLTDGQGVLTNLITDSKMRNNAIAQIAAEAKLYDGVNLDFEGLGWREQGAGLTAVRNNFTDFVNQLAAELKKEGIKLTLTLHAPNSAYQGYDYQALGQIADEIVIMAYDYGPKPEPINLVNDAIVTAKALVPAEKLVLGISAPYETAESMANKIKLAKTHHLKGIALWRLGLVSDEQWATIKGTLY